MFKPKLVSVCEPVFIVSCKRRAHAQRPVRRVEINKSAGPCKWQCLGEITALYLYFLQTFRVGHYGFCIAYPRMDIPPVRHIVKSAAVNAVKAVEASPVQEYEARGTFRIIQFIFIKTPPYLQKQRLASLAPRRHSVVLFVKLRKVAYEVLWATLDNSVGSDEMFVFIVNYGPTEIGITVQKIKEHRATAHKRFKISERLASADRLRQPRVYQRQKAAFASRPLHKGSAPGVRASQHLLLFERKVSENNAKGKGPFYPGLRKSE